MTTRTAIAEQALPDIFYEEPGPVEDGMQQTPIITQLLSALMAWFKGENVFVGGGGFIFWNPANGNDRVAPDGMVALDTDPESVYEFSNYLIWEVGKAPDLVMEMASPSTAGNDLGPKRNLYASLGVSEYWRFDPTGGELYGAPLLGERLVDGQYVPYELNEEPDGSVWSHSEVLGLQFWWDGLNFDIRDPVTNQSINPAVVVDVVERELEQSERRAERERTRADAAELAADVAEREREREMQARLEAEQRAERERAARLRLEARLGEMSEDVWPDQDSNEDDISS